MNRGTSLPILAKGSRSRPVSQVHARHGGFNRGSIGGAAEHSIKKAEVGDYEDLGMEAIWKIQVEDFPAFVIINHEGRDSYTELPADKSGGLISLKS